MEMRFTSRNRELLAKIKSMSSAMSNEHYKTFTAIN